ncbi:MAG TPA: PAS domain S-box protein [Acetobacteraceae bacterium]|jgi:PAS domain S-box-containing protein|nr:PAS domain S-box protein [Acetobacteraceae bacterium]
MDASPPDRARLKPRRRLSNEQLRVAEAGSGIGVFEIDLTSDLWVTTPQVAVLFGFTPTTASQSLTEWEPVIFPDDLQKLRAAINTASPDKAGNIEIRVRHADGSIHWLAVKGEFVQAGSDHAPRLRGICYDVTERKTLDARLLALTETLEARVAEVHAEARILEIINRVGIALAAELDLERLVQTATNAGVEITNARFGAFFYYVTGGDGEPYTLGAFCAMPTEAFASFPIPHDTAIFQAVFRGLGPVRSNDILTDPRYRQDQPHLRIQAGHPPVRSYLAVPVISRSGDILGGMFFGHPEPGVFSERAERIVAGIAAQTAVAVDNARLYQRSQQEIAERTRTERALQALNDTLEQRVNERAQQLKASFDQLRESEHRFRLLVEAVTDYAIFMLDPEGYVVNWNPGAERLKGYTDNEIVGQHFSCFYPEEDRQSGVPELVLNTAASKGKFEAEGWRVRKGGSRFWASVVVHAILDRQGHLLGFSKVTHDLTEKRAAEEKLRQAQKMEAIGQLTGGIAHDFNNLLTVISGNMETLQRRLSQGGEDRLLRFVNSALLASSRAAILTHHLLAFARRQPLDPKLVSANTLITGVSEMLRRTLGETISIETVLAGGVWTTFADANQLENSLLNLAVNARDAMPGGGKLTIEAANVYLDEAYAATADVSPGQYVGLFVSDTGIGMPPDVVSRAFDPFFTTKDVGQGTGLGLSQVYGFVKQSDGHVRIYSEVGAGTTVKIYLPRHISADGAGDERSADLPVPRGHGETILVVEDEPGVRRLATDMLLELGYGVLDASDGTTALRVIDAHREIELLFTDIGLPGGMNGRQLADEVLRRRPGLKVLFTSGYARNAIVHHGRLDPGVQLIVKPFTFAGLAAKMRHVLDGS